MFKTVIWVCSLCLLLSAQGWGQVDLLTNNYLPAPGTSISYNYDEAMDSAFYASLEAGIAGPKVWDFSSRAFIPAYSQVSVSLANTPSADSFPGANLAILMVAGMDSIWTLSKSESDVFGSVGMVRHSFLGPSLIVYQNTAPEFVFPITFASQWTSYRHWSQPAGIYYTNHYDTTRYIADAWGTAVYGSKSIPCLRIKAHETIYNITFIAPNVPINTTRTDIDALYFVAVGFDLFASACKTVSVGDTSYSLTATNDFVQQPTDVASGSGELPSNFVLGQNYPNPFNPTTTIEYSLPERSHVTLNVYNVAGQRVRALVGSEQAAGKYHVTWDGTDDGGNCVATGMYFYRLQAGDLFETKKMVLLK